MSATNELDLGETIDLPQSSAQSSAAGGAAQKVLPNERGRTPGSSDRPAAVLVEGSGTGLTDQTGTPHFMAPEQALGESPDERSDIYSLGVVAWFLATGRLLFEESNPLKVIMAHSHQTVRRPSEFNSDISAAFDGAILACLEKQPANRPQSVSELRRLLRAVPPTSGWWDEQAAQWWKCHGCPNKKKLDDAVQAGHIA